MDKFKKKPRLPKWCLDKNYKEEQLDDYSCWTDRMQPRNVADTDPRDANDALNPDKPKGMGGSDL